MDISILIGPSRLKISPKIHPIQLEELRKQLKYRIKNYQYTKAYKSRGWDGYIMALKKDQTAPSGLYRMIAKRLKQQGHTVNIEYAPNIPPTGRGEILDLTPDEFQKKAMRAAAKYRRGIIWARIRSGKTAIIAMVTDKINTHPVWILTSALMGGVGVVDQTRDELQRFLGRPVGIFSEGVYEPEDITVSSYAALNRALNYNKKSTSKAIADRNERIKKHVFATKALILDECHHSFSEKTAEALDKFENIGYKIGLSGTPHPSGISKKEVESKLGPVIAKNNFKDLVDQGRLAKPVVYMYDIPYKWFGANFNEYSDAYMMNIVENEYRNMFIAEVAKNLIKRNKTVYILVRRKIHGPILREKLPGSVWLSGEIKSTTRKNMYTALQKGNLKCIITTVGREGLNLPKLDSVINAEGLSSKVSTVQKMRSLTASKGKKYGIVVDFFDKGKYLADHSDARYTEYKKNKGLKVKIKKVPAGYFNEEDE